jgi:hypothetical protein
MVDAADSDKIEAARNELHNLLEKPQLAGIPVLVLGMSSMKVFPNLEHGEIVLRHTCYFPLSLVLYDSEETGVADPELGSGAFLTPGSGMGKNQDLEPDLG